MLPSLSLSLDQTRKSKKYQIKQEGPEDHKVAHLSCIVPFGGPLKDRNMKLGAKTRSSEHNVKENFILFLLAASIWNH